MLAAVDVNEYRAEAEEFLSALDREYYLHFAGLKDDFEIEAIYTRHAPLFSREAVEDLRGGESRPCSNSQRKATSSRPSRSSRRSSPGSRRASRSKWMARRIRFARPP
jgi:hypothetical protein